MTRHLAIIVLALCGGCADSQRTIESRKELNEYYEAASRRTEQRVQQRSQWWADQAINSLYMVVEWKLKYDAYVSHVATSEIPDAVKLGSSIGYVVGMADGTREDAEMLCERVLETRDWRCVREWGEGQKAKYKYDPQMPEYFRLVTTTDATGTMYSFIMDYAEEGTVAYFQAWTTCDEAISNAWKYSEKKVDRGLEPQWVITSCDALPVTNNVNVEAQ